METRIKDMKTYSTPVLAGVFTLMVAALWGITAFAEDYFQLSLITELLMSGIMLIGVFFFAQYIIRDHINAKIEPIYKVIRSKNYRAKDYNRSGVPSNDITDVQKEVEQWAKDKTTEISRLKDLERYRKEFVGNVSHELKTPIFNIQGYILTLLEGGIDDPKINIPYLKRTEQSIDRMITIVEDLETINKFESGVLRLRYQDFDMAQLVKDTFEMEQMIAEERNIKLIFKRPDKQVMVNADRHRMSQVLTNLISNAIKYGRDNGFVQVTFYDMKEYWMVEVVDNGLGISSEDVPRVFERFFRADKSRSRKQGGTGLGLSIVKHIMEAHNQTINVKSELNVGTTFTFTVEKSK
ncbi:MAG: sensor histidine kinase [Mangrovibacterium sp.]